ncbi:MAG: tetraacyldisaccharide 4'-kinase, partial [Gemmatimonadaceae bacterium]
MRVEDVWYGDGARARLARTVLMPASWLYHGVTAIRNTLYNIGLARTHSSPIPVISVGNLTVGGTGKTPFTAHLVHLLSEMGRRPAIVMRGYGGDEKLLHERLNPGIRVYVSPDRAAGVALAAAKGADVVVLDDAFQHRRAARCLDVVLVSAEQWRDDLKILPAGPLRESFTGLRRA